MHSAARDATSCVVSAPSPGSRPRFRTTIWEIAKTETLGCATWMGPMSGTGTISRRIEKSAAVGPLRVLADGGAVLADPGDLDAAVGQDVVVDL